MNVKVKIFKTIILPVVLFGFEAWYVTSRKDTRLGVFENRVLRRIFGPRRDEVTGEWRKMHNGEHHNLYCSSEIVRQIKSRKMRWAGHVACMGEGRNLYRVLEGKLEGERPLGRPRNRWEGGIRLDLGEMEGYGVDLPGSG
jgi:hypothetical protein